MDLVDDPDTASWLERFSGAAADIEWDAGNREKNRKHGVEPMDVQHMLQSPVVLAGRIVAPSHDEPRWLALGVGRTGRGLALIFTRRADRIRPISCRAMRRLERRIYEEATRDG